MTELEISRLDNGQILLEMDGTTVDLSVMLCEAMMGNEDIAAIVMGAIPAFLDQKGFSRKGYCETVMNAQGTKGNKK